MTSKTLDIIWAPNQPTFGARTSRDDLLCRPGPISNLKAVPGPGDNMAWFVQICFWCLAGPGWLYGTPFETAPHIAEVLICVRRSVWPFSFGFPPIVFFLWQGPGRAHETLWTASRGLRFPPGTHKKTNTLARPDWAARSLNTHTRVPCSGHVIFNPLGTCN